MCNSVDYSQLLERRLTGHAYPQHAKIEASMLFGMYRIQSVYRSFFEYVSMSADSLFNIFERLTCKYC